MNPRILTLCLACVVAGCFHNAADAGHRLSPAERASLTKTIAGFGVYEGGGGSDGYRFSFNCGPKRNSCHVEEGLIGDDLVEHGTAYDFPFVAAEWVHAEYDRGGDWRKMPALLHATSRPYQRHYHEVPAPSGQHYCGSVIEPGETCTTGGLMPDEPKP
jgi:hypothetical protein